MEGGFCGLPQAAAAAAAKRVSEQLLSNTPKMGPEGPQTSEVTASFQFGAQKPYTALSPVVLWPLTLQWWGRQGQAAQPCLLPHNCGL